MYLTIFDPGAHLSQEAIAIDAASLYRAFEQVKDGRGAKGKRYPQALLLTLLMLGKLAGEQTIQGVVEWVEERQGWLKAQLDWPKRFPVHSTYREALARCDAQQLVQAIAQVLVKARATPAEHAEASPAPAQPGEGDHLLHTAMDGKTLRGTLGHESEQQLSVHLLSLYECERGIVLAQQAVRSKENEISAAGAFLYPLLVKDRIVSTDAMHTQKKWFAGVHGSGGYYFSVVKANHPTAYQDLVDFFADAELDQGEWDSHRTVQKGHGRLEIRELWRSTQMNEWFEQEWAGIAQVVKIRRHVTTKEKEREEIVYGFTNFPRTKARAKRLLELNQKHWAIEIV